MQRFKIFLQYCLPQHLLSRLVGWIADCPQISLKDFLIQRFMAHFSVDMSQCERKYPSEYKTFNDFFTRKINLNITPVPGSILSPATGTVSQIGKIHDQQILQAKGHSYSVESLLGQHPAKANLFRNGHFVTIYLAPRDYHRVHMPLAGQLQEMKYIPGDLFSVNELAVEHIPNLFARNERVVSLFETEQGPMAVVMVGAMAVGSIEMVWSDGPITPVSKQVRHWQYGPAPYSIALTQGQEMGHFRMGSTAIVLLPKGAGSWLPHLTEGSKLQVGEIIGNHLSPHPKHRTQGERG